MDHEYLKTRKIAKLVEQNLVQENQVVEKRRL